MDTKVMNTKAMNTTEIDPIRLACVYRRGLLALLLFGASAMMLPALAQTDMAEGQVRRVDAANNKITIRHGEIKSLDMPPMSMVFVAKPASILNGIAAGDKIRFTAIEENSQYVVTKIEKVAQ
jgi:Cu(I)/Ag(I) efflux system periplasmic protein CusF